MELIVVLGILSFVVWLLWAVNQGYAGNPRGRRLEKQELREMAYQDSNPNFLTYTIVQVKSGGQLTRVETLKNINAQGAYTRLLNARKRYKNAVGYAEFDPIPFSSSVDANPLSWDRPVGHKYTKIRLKQTAKEQLNFRQFEILIHTNYGLDEYGQESFRDCESKRHRDISAKEAWRLADLCVNKNRAICYEFYALI